MKRLLLLILLLPGSVWASSGEGHPLQKAHNDLRDLASLQSGAKYFVNYCMGCHSLKYSRFQRLAQDLRLTEEQVKANLMFTAEKVGESMSIAMSPNDGKKWFGVAPPDLTVTARIRGTDWLYTYLMSFYLDPSRPSGVNNLLFRDVAMPHVLWELQGWQKPVYEEAQDKEETAHKTIKSLELVGKDKMSPMEHSQKTAEYRRVVRDLVNFLEYVGEPAKLERQSLGKWVLLFLIAFTFVAYMLKKEYWKDVH